MEEKMRINKYLAGLGVGSRREIDRLCEAGRIRVNDQVAASGIKVNEEDKIELDGKEISKQEEKKVYIILNKPKKYLSAVKDDRGRKTILDIVKVKERIYPVGRLDYDTEGLILLTNDGELYNNIIHPRSEVYKTYRAKVVGKVTRDKIKELEKGIELEDGPTLPARGKVIKAEEKTSVVEISIREGRNRQVRRMLRKIGHRVLELERRSIGNLNLGDLEIGKWRELTKEELKYLKKL